MVYRESPGTPCGVCDRTPTQACACCSRPVCDRHLTAATGWCRRCDDELYMFVKKGDGDSAVRVWAFGLVPMIVLPIVFAPLGVISLAYGFVGLPYALWRGRRRRRLKFIAVTHARGQLPARTEGPSEEAIGLADYEHRMHERQRGRLGDGE